jgi:hypothetical protein
MCKIQFAVYRGYNGRLQTFQSKCALFSSLFCYVTGLLATEQHKAKRKMQNAKSNALQVFE